MSDDPYNRPREPIFNPKAFEAWPVVALVLIFIAIQASFEIFDWPFERAVLWDYAFFSNRFWRGEDLGGLVTHAFLHGGWLHLGMNSAAFLALGSLCWRLMGSANFVFFFLVCAIAGALAFALVRPGETGPLVGASGAIFGLLAAVKRTEFKARANRGEDMRKQAFSFLGQMVLLNAAIGLLTAGMMAWEAHLGGMALGWLITPYMMSRD